MSTLWTPGGERPVGGSSHDGPPAAGPAGAGAASGPAPFDDEGDFVGPDGETAAEMEARMAELRVQLAETPAAVVVANHCFGLFELAAVHLSLRPPQLDEAQIAIDALGAIADGLAGRLGEEEENLREGLTQLRLAYVQMKGALGASGGPAA